MEHEVCAEVLKMMVFSTRIEGCAETRCEICTISSTEDSFSLFNPIALVLWWLLLLAEAKTKD